MITKGRQKGAKNRIGSTAKDNIQSVFTRLGGYEAMTKWAKANETQFYQIYSKLVPHEVTGSGPDGEHVIKQYVVKLVQGR